MIHIYAVIWCLVWGQSLQLRLSCTNPSNSHFPPPADTALRDCACPQECNVYSYALQPSSASLASVGVRQIRGDIDNKVTKSYHRALDMRDRMEPEHFYSTLSKLKLVLDRMEGNIHQGSILLTWSNHGWVIINLEWDVISYPFPNFQRCNRWSLGMGKQFYRKLYDRRNYLSMLS